MRTDASSHDVWHTNATTKRAREDTREEVKAGVETIAQSTITLDSTVAASQDLVSADLGDETVVLDLKRGVYYRFDPLAARIWKLIQEPRSVREVRDTLLDEYTADARRCEGILMTLLKQLVQNALIDVFTAA